MTTDPSQDPNSPTHHRRSREEVETLAKNFVGTPADELPSAKGSRNLLIVSGAGALILVAGIVAVFATSSRGKENRPNADAERVAAEAKEWAARLEAEKERKRKELEAGSGYLDRIAAADAALLKEMSSQAEMLARRVAAAPAPTSVSDAPPTPREAPRTTPPATTVASTQPKPTTTTTSSAPAQAPPQQTAAATTTQAAPTQAAPVQVAQADKSECSIHVSELSKSGKLTYADVAKMKGARLNDNGNVFTPPVDAGGRMVVFEVFPNGCVQMVRSTLGR
jgi:hypothetical protein